MNLFKRCAAFLAVCSISVSLLCIQSSAAETSESLIVGDIYSAGANAYKAWSGSSDGSEYTGYDPGDIFSSGSSGEFVEDYISYIEDLPANKADSEGNLIIDDFVWELVEAYNYFDNSAFVSANGECSYNGYVFASADSKTRLANLHAYLFLHPGLYDLVLDDASGLGSEKSSVSYRIVIQGSLDGITWSDAIAYVYDSGSDSFSTYDFEYTYWRINAPIVALDSLSAGETVNFSRASHLVYYPDSSSGCIEMYSGNTRPGSLSVHYGVAGDDDTVTSLGEQKIVDESSSLYYNPVTDTSSAISSWSFDYPTRTYDLTLSDESSVSVEYADDGVNITEGETAYAVCYLVSAETEPGEPVDPGSCDHRYTCETTTAPTCVLDNQKTRKK